MFKFNRFKRRRSYTWVKIIIFEALFYVTDQGTVNGKGLLRILYSTSLDSFGDIRFAFQRLKLYFISLV